MIPQIKNYTYSDKKIYLGKLAFDGEGFNAILGIINGKLLGDGDLPLFIKQTRDIGCRYAISVKEEGIFIAGSKDGIYPAFSTLLKLVERDEKGTYIKECEITDEARFNYRSGMLDEARHFFGKEKVKEFIDVLFALKYNVFHWHLSDDQGFRLYFDDMDEICKHASKRDNSVVGGYLFGKPNNVPHEGIYYKEDVEEIMAYASERGVKVIPELDLPGHFSAILSAKPEFTCDGKSFPVPGGYGVLENVICLGNDEATKFAKELLLKVARLFKTDVMHVGFDEIKTNKLQKCEKCQARIKELGLADEKALIEHFRKEVRDYLGENGVNIICWNDGLTEVDEKCVVQHWKPGTVKETVKRINGGQRMIISDFTNYYLDYPYSMTPLRKTYEHNPVFEGVERHENVVGVEAPFWTEWAEEWDKIRFNGYYRLAAIAESAWNERKRPYECFIEDLRANEELYFGDRLDIPEALVNPKFGMLKNIGYLFSDNNGEMRNWLRQAPQ